MERIGLAGLSIRAKLLVIVMITTGLALLLAGVALVTYDIHNYRKQQTASLTAQADMLGAISSAALAFDDTKAAQEYLSTLRVKPSISQAILFGPTGKVFAAYYRDGATAQRLATAEVEGARMEGDDLLVTRRVNQGREVLGSVLLRANLNQRARLLSYAGLVLLLSIAAMSLALLLLGRLQRLISQPILEVAAVARGVVDRQDYTPRVAKRGGDEVGVLVDAFNEMLARIQRRESELQDTNAALQSEIGDHKAAREEVAALNQSLELRVTERTVELEALNRELESFSYSVSHDLRAPLRSIDGFTALLEKSYADRFDDQGKGYLNRVRFATQRMGHLIDDLLTLSRTARSVMVRRHVDLSGQAEAIVHDLREGTPERQVEVNITPGMEVQADSELMRTVLENLLGNAWKFTAKKPNPRIEFGWYQEPDSRVYFVKDNGAGFDMKYVDKIFGAFQRLHASSEFEGTGVGLASVQRILRRHGGDVWCEGEVDQGAAIYFTLPS
jgi:signal transduction histidine kinase